MSRTDLRGWRNPDVARPWYPIGALGRSNVMVELALEGGYEIIGKIAKHSESRRWAWWELKPRRRAWSLLMPYRIPPATGSRCREPTGWRPLPGVIWPDPLPDPLTMAVAPPPPPPPEAEPPPLPEVDGWPYPGIRLGEREPPVSLEETEARVLRGIRRMDSMPRVGLQHSGMSSDIPGEFFHLMRRHQLAEDLAEALREGRMLTDALPARAAWAPTRRDNGDWDYALDWWRQLPVLERRLVRYRAANPVYSWRQIAGMEHMSATYARALYRAAIRTMFDIARRSDG